jgi:hypothetical protein
MQVIIWQAEFLLWNPISNFCVCLSSCWLKQSSASIDSCWLIINIYIDIVASDTLNIMAEQLALLFHIWEVPVSSLGPETGNPDWKSVIFLSPSRQMSVSTLN